CMQTESIHTREFFGCGYLPPPPDGKVRLTVWRHPGDTESPAPTTCVGYTTKLPEVREAARAHLHWSKGALFAFDRKPHENLIAAIELLHHASNEVDAWDLEQRKGRT